MTYTTNDAGIVERYKGENEQPDLLNVKGLPPAKVNLQAVDFPKWFKKHIPESMNAHVTMSMDVEGAEYVVMRNFIISGEVCRVHEIDFEGHKL